MNKKEKGWKDKNRKLLKMEKTLPFQRASPHKQLPHNIFQAPPAPREAENRSFRGQIGWALVKKSLTNLFYSCRIKA